ncbi:MAG: zinc-binding alcohol dehydrogenase family protein [Propionicimonas sp.]
MRAAVLTSPGAVPMCTDFPDPDPLPGREPLELVAAGMHQVVRSVASGRHYGSTGEYPLVPGVDAVARRADGGLVYTGNARPPWGTMAERLVTPFDLPLPDGVDPVAIAAGMNPGMAGFIPLTRHLERRGELGVVLILGATGMAGRLAVQTALALGATRVVAAGRDRPSLDALQAAGAEAVSLADSAEPLTRAVRAATPGLVLDFVWGPVAEQAFAALARRGLDEDDADISYVQIGALAGPDAAVPASLLRSRRITLSGSGAGSLSMTELFAQLPRLVALISDGVLEVPYTTYPLSRVAEAWTHTGRTRAVVTPG